jgi:hypothetical protein
MTLVAAIGFAAAGFAQEQHHVAKYVPVLPEVKARALPVDRHG